MQEHLWLVISALLVFMMQIGFLCLESGRTRSKNSINVAAKNISDFILSSMLFWLAGFGLMFGSSLNGFFGTSLFMFGDNQTPYDLSFFLFQMMFCGTAATLTSGATAERMTFNGYILITAILCILIYPVVGHWVWSGVFEPSNPGWLQAIGFVDFAGATVVHSVGSWIALAAVLIIGPRDGRYQNKHRFPSGSNLPMATMGTLLVWLGWFGFNGGSALVFNESVPGILVNTCLSAVWAGFIASCLHYKEHRYIEVSYILNGIIAGLVGITAACHAVTPQSAAIIGMISGIILFYGTRWIDYLQIDDALHVIPAHLFAGIWGTIAFAVFAQPEFLPENTSRTEQLGIQLLGVAVVGLYSFTLAFILLLFMNRYIPLRVNTEDEVKGLNITEHQASTELIDLLSEMETQQHQGHFTTPVKEEPFTEVGQIAKKYNEVINRIHLQMLQRDQAIYQFKESERRKSAILDSSMDCIITIDWRGRMLEFNPAAERILGCLKHQVINKKFHEHFILNDDIQGFKESLQHHFSTASGLILNTRNRIKLSRVSGHTFPAEVTITSARCDDLSRVEFTLHIRDMTRDHKLQSRLSYLAYKDPLTNLSNRAHLMKSLNVLTELAERENKRIALMFMDLDQFKKVNDTMGHKIGDELLCEVSRRLRKISRSEDIISRWGGDEFIIALYGDLTEETVCSKAQQILEVLRTPVNLAGKSFSIPTSIGISLSDNGETDIDQLIQQADIAMYSAKSHGRDNYKCFEPYMAEQANKTVSYERMIKRALVGKEFHLVYQPKVYHDASNIVSLEALIRWQHPEKGIIPPGEFIPIAEESNLILQLGELVIAETIQQLASWRKQGLRLLPVSVNISGKHLVSEELVPFIKQQLSLYAIPGRYLEIEITEGVLIQDIERCIEVLHQLKQLDISLSVDDFGTGYSSLNYLKRLPLDILKIDQSFVEECASKEEDGEICATIINLAHSLNLNVVAEGVEEDAQLQTLLGFGCETFQGYLFYKPLPPEEIGVLLTPLNDSEYITGNSAQITI